MQKLGFPNVSDQTLLVQTDLKNSSKEPRRQSVGARFRIVLLMGDDLNDFAQAFEDLVMVDEKAFGVALGYKGCLVFRDVLLGDQPACELSQITGRIAGLGGNARLYQT